MINRLQISDRKKLPHVGFDLGTFYVWDDYWAIEELPFSWTLIPLQKIILYLFLLNQNPSNTQYRGTWSDVPKKQKGFRSDLIEDNLSNYGRIRHSKILLKCGWRIKFTIFREIKMSQITGFHLTTVVAIIFYKIKLLLYCSTKHTQKNNIILLIGFESQINLSVMKRGYISFEVCVLNDININFTIPLSLKRWN